MVVEKTNEYETLEESIASIKENVIGPAEAKVKELRRKSSDEDDARSTIMLTTPTTPRLCAGRRARIFDLARAKAAEDFTYDGNHPTDKETRENTRGSR